MPPLGPGPVIIVELKALARRWQTFAMRSILVSVLLLAFSAVYLRWYVDRYIIGGRISLRDYSEIGTIFANAIMGTQLVLVLLAAPAATAGAVCIDKARGNLTLLLGTGMSSFQIILGKLFARLLPVLCLIAASLPVLFIATMLGGISVDQLLGGFIVLFGAALFGCSLALLLSVFVTKTQEALLIAYFILFAWLLAFPINSLIDYFTVATGVNSIAFAPASDDSHWLAVTNPYMLLQAPTDPTFGLTVWDYWLYSAVMVGMSAICVAIAVVKLRKTVLRQTSAIARRKRGRRRKTMRLPNRDVLRWYERYRRRPTKAGRIVWLMYIAMSLVGAIGVLLSYYFNAITTELASMTNGFLVGIGLLLVTIGAVTTLADERTRGSLDILLLTPVETGHVIWAKWRSAYAATWKVMLVPSLIVAIVVFKDQFWQVQRWYHHRDYLESFLFFLAFMSQMLLAGALFTSIGMLCATRFKNFGQAVGMATTIYLVVSIGWLIFNNIFIEWGDRAGAMLVSPIGAAFTWTNIFEAGFLPQKEMFLVIYVMATFAYSVLSIFFFAATWIIFNRKMGRISRARPVLPEDRSIWQTPILGGPKPLPAES